MKCPHCKGTGKIKIEKPEQINPETWGIYELIDAVNYLLKKSK